MMSNLVTIEESRFNRKINDLINSLEIITYYKHHYVRKTGLKKALKDFLKEEATMQILDDWLIKGKYND